MDDLLENQIKGVRGRVHRASVSFKSTQTSLIPLSMGIGA